MSSPKRSGLSKGRIYALQQHLKAHTMMLKEELDLLFDNPVAVAGHADYFKSVEDKICELAEYQGALDVLESTFMDDQ
jgi:hypothetical protein